MSVDRFTDIGQFRNVIRSVADRTRFDGFDGDGNVILKTVVDMPKITFNGTVKLHGTNASCGFDNDGEIFYQSRRSVITIENDNAGFAFFANSKKDTFNGWYDDIKTRLNIIDSSIIFFGEWCGGNIQKGVSINGLEKMFVLFAVKIVPNDVEESSYYLYRDEWKELNDVDNLIFNINDFESFKIEIDFNNPKMSQNKIVELVEVVEKECPVGKAFGRVLDKDCTIGEGIVWVGWYDGQRYVFKTKGDKHSISKVKTVAPVDVEKLNSINEFVDYAVTENRLNQAIEQVFTINNIRPDIKKTGDYIRWVITDIIKEEIDVMVENKLEPKDVNKHISTSARKWFFKFLDEMEY